jgi:hypothetical protein
MFSDRKYPKTLIILIIAALLAVTLACGESETPEKVGEVATEAPAAEEKAVEETEDPEPEAEEGTSPTSTPQPTQPAPENYQVGDIVNIGDIVMVVLGWEIPEGDDFNQPEEGKKFIAVELLFVNQGDDARSISTMMQMALKDESGQQYDVDFMGSSATGSSSPDGEIGPGERIRGKVGYQVPEDVTDLTFVYDADFFSAGKVFVELGDEPVTLDPPEEIAGEQAVDAYAVGDVIEIGQMALTVNEVTYPAGDDFNQPDEGKKFVVVDVTFENKASEAKTLSTIMQMTLKDTTGQGYDVDLMATAVADGSSPDGEIAPGETIRGQVGYQVPEDAEDLMFVFDADVFGHGKVFVELPQQP